MITVQTIQLATSAYFGQPVIDMKSARRARQSARPRQVAMYLARQLTPLSLPAIGVMFGNRDHTTVINAIERVETLMSSDAMLARAVKDLTRQLGPGARQMERADFELHVESIIADIRTLMLSLYPAQSSEVSHASDS